jgi:hypothetical protein
MALKFCVERIIQGVPYPNLAIHKATPYTLRWRQFSVCSPFSEPVMLFTYLNQCEIRFELIDIMHTNNTTFYPIALSFFDFSINWFELMSTQLLAKLQQQQIKLLFFYSEGDNPQRIYEHMHCLASSHQVSMQQIKFISANSKAAKIPNFHYFIDDEILFRYRNHNIAPALFHNNTRSKKFTALVRMHKFWRANTMSELWANLLHNEGYFSYGTTIIANETENDNPIEVDSVSGLRLQTRQFLAHCPFVADPLTIEQHNDHTLSFMNHYNDSYVNIVLESHMDVDQSQGVFLTEKTFKPIKNTQMFIIFGAAGSLQQLRELGYRTFDHVLDNTYDTITDTTTRWKHAIKLTINLLSLNIHELHEVYCKCRADLIHNQELFLSSKQDRLEKLIKEIISEPN